MVVEDPAEGLEAALAAALSEAESESGAKVPEGGAVYRQDVFSDEEDEDDEDDYDDDSDSEIGDESD